MNPIMAVEVVDMEAVFPDACRERKEELDGLRGLAVQLNELLIQNLKPNSLSEPSSFPDIRGAQIVSEVLGSLSDSMSRFQASRALLYQNSGFSLPISDISRIMDCKKLITWIDSIPADSELTRGLQPTRDSLQIMNDILSTPKNGKQMTDILSKEFRELSLCLFNLRSFLTNNCKANLPPGS